MKTKKKKISVEGLSNRKPWQRLDEMAKSKIIRDVTIGHMSYREVSRKYSLSRNTIKKWVSAARVTKMLKSKTPNFPDSLNSDMKENGQDRLLQQQVKMLTQELARTKLKAEAFETMIIVAEQEYKIKIRKKRGTSQSVECGKAAQK